jgi:predicted RNA-binding Zn ribbon-like protein
MFPVAGVAQVQVEAQAVPGARLPVVCHLREAARRVLAARVSRRL